MFERAATILSAQTTAANGPSPGLTAICVLLAALFLGGWWNFRKVSPSERRRLYRVDAQHRGLTLLRRYPVYALFLGLCFAAMAVMAVMALAAG